MNTIAPGIQELNDLQEAGFTSEQIDAWKINTTQELNDAGFDSKQIDEYFGYKEPDMTPTKNLFETNLSKKAAEEAEKKASSTAAVSNEPQPADPTVKEADTFLKAIEAGFDMSVTGLIKNGKPDVVLPENAPMFYRIASMVSQMAGDVPAMVAGGIGGAAAGSAVPVVGNVIGAAAGSFALPEGLRTALIEHYEKGDVESFGDFWERASAIAVSSAKGAVIGGVTAGVGGLVAKGVAKVAAPVAAKTLAQLTSEVATMTTIGAGLEGHVPEPMDFVDAAILVGGMHGSVAAAKKIRKMYAKTGATPVEVSQSIETDMNLKQQILSDNVEVPGMKQVGEPGKFVMEEPKALVEAKARIKESVDYNPNHSPEVNAILGKVGEKAEGPKKSLSGSQLYTAFVDKLNPINDAVKTLTEGKVEIKADENPYILSRLSVDAKAKAKHIFENGTLDFNTLQKNGKSLKKILEPVKDVEQFEAYLISKRVLEKSSQGKMTGFDTAAAEKVVKAHEAEYAAHAKELTDFQNRNLDYVRDSGILSAEQTARIKEMNKDYVPFKRLTDPAEQAEVGAKRRGGRGGSLKEFKGSDREIQSPIQSIIENTQELVRLAEVNKPKKALVDLAGKTPGQELIKAVPDRMQAIKVEASEIVRALEDQGAITTIESIKRTLKEKGIKVTDETVAEAFKKENIVEAGAIEDMLIFRKQQTDLTPNQFAVYEGGKRKVYETTPELAEAITKLDGDRTSTNLLFKIANGITTVKKIGITFTPDFIARNFFRDFFTASTFSKSKGINPMDVLGALGDIWKKNDTYYEWLKSGGANGAFLDMGTKYIDTGFYKLQKETNFLNAARNIVEKPIDAMRVGAELSEQALRVAEFKKVREMGGTVREGGYASREITIDFQRVGAKISALNAMTAFMNVSIQGLDRTARAFKDNPTALATKSVAYITVPSVLLWWANKDDERVQQVPRWEKDHFWIVATDNWQTVNPEEADGLPEYLVRQNPNGSIEVNKGTLYRFPKPQELGLLFGSLPERVMEAFFGQDPKAFGDFAKSLGDTITPSFVPDAVAPAMEQFFNRSFFTGRDIVPAHLKDVLPEYQYSEYTSDTAKALGKIIPSFGIDQDFSSPMVLDNYIRSWGGSIGQYALQISDASLRAAGVSEDKVKPSATLADVPFIKSFVVRYPGAGAKSIQDFYDEYDKAVRIPTTVEKLQKEGNFEEAEKLMTEKQAEFAIGKMAEKYKAVLSLQTQQIKRVNADPSMTADDKRRLIDGQYYQMIEATKEVNKVIKGIRDELSAQP